MSTVPITETPAATTAAGPGLLRVCGLDLSITAPGICLPDGTTRTAVVEFGDERLPRRFWDKARATESGCWEWQRSKNHHGYGRYRLDGNGQELGAHRVAFAALIGPVPSGLHVLHDCDNPPCVNPGHLHAGTQAQNMREMSERGRARNQSADKTHCPQLHPLSGDNLYTHPDGKRSCRSCRREAKRRYRQRNIGRKPMESFNA